MNRRSLLTGLVLAPWFLAPRRAESLCMVLVTMPTLLTAVDAPLPPDATFVLTLAPSVGTTGPSRPLPDEAALVRDGERIQLRLETLAEALGRLVPVTPPSPGRWRLVGLPHDVDVEIGAPRPMPTAPGVRAVTLAQAHRTERYGERRFTTCSVQFDREPSGAFVAALAVYDGVTDTVAPAALVFAADPVGVRATGVGNAPVWLVPPPPGHCGFGRTGTAPTPGHRVAFRWIDRAGRILPMTAPVVVRT